MDGDKGSGGLGFGGNQRERAKEILPHAPPQARGGPRGHSEKEGAHGGWGGGRLDFATASSIRERPACRARGWAGCQALGSRASTFSPSLPGLL